MGLYILPLHMLRPGGDIHKLIMAALVFLVCLEQLLQQHFHLLQDIGGQHVAKSAQKVWAFFIEIHIHVSVSFSLINEHIYYAAKAGKEKKTEDVGGIGCITTMSLGFSYNP